MTALEVVEEVARKYRYGHDRWDQNHADQVARLAQEIGEQLQGLKLMPRRKGDLPLLRAAALAHDIGRNPRSRGGGEHNRRSYETLKEELADAAPQDQEAETLLYCVLHHRGDQWQQDPTTGVRPRQLAGIIRVADALDYGLDQAVKSIKLRLEEGKIVLEAELRAPADMELRRAQAKADLFREALQREVVFRAV